MLWRVPWRSYDIQPDLSQVDGVTFHQRAMVEEKATRRTGAYGGPCTGGQLPTPGDKVVVYVGFQGVDYLDA